MPRNSVIYKNQFIAIMVEISATYANTIPNIIRPRTSDINKSSFFKGGGQINPAFNRHITNAKRIGQTTGNLNTGI